jgi:UDP-GlcNAc:undecaprenyl-phosphate GlcNAc-1-phosphate transferase
MARYVTNPAGGLLYLNQWEVFGIALPGAILSIVWIVLLMNAVNFLDGLDGLASAVSVVGFLTIGAVSLLPHVNEPAVALPAFLAAGATLGFLFWNFPPARLYLGTPGSWFLGFLLGVFSLQGSSKIATLAVVGAIPLLDAVAVVLSRLRRGTPSCHCRANRRTPGVA